MASNRIRTVIFEDDRFDRRAIMSIINGIPEILVVGIFDTKQVALRECTRLRPDLIIADADIRSDKSAGPTFVKNVLNVLPNVKILGLTKHPDCLDPLKRAGCKEAILKQFFDNEDAAKRFITETLLPSPIDYTEIVPPQLDRDEDLVLRMVANGRTENEIGTRMNKTRKQVRTIKASLKEKFGVTTGKDTQLVSHAYRLGYLKPEEDLAEY